MNDTLKRTRTLRLGTRGSKLAKWQAEWVAGELHRRGHVVELVEIATHGDLEQVVAVEEIGTRGVFTKEIQRALLAGDVDIAVHSLKDLPTEPIEGLVLAAVPGRERAADVLVVRSEERGARSEVRGVGGRERGGGNEDLLSKLPRGTLVGTGSLRRQAQLRHVRPDLNLLDIRGNVDTRLRKLDEGQYDAIVLAEAGLSRLGLADRISQVLPLELMLPAVGQGALGIECRADDTETRSILAVMEDAATRAAVTAERALLEHLRGGCMAPIGALGSMRDTELTLSAVVLSSDGTQRLTALRVGSPDTAESLGIKVAEALLAQGAAQLIASSRDA